MGALGAALREDTLAFRQDGDALEVRTTRGMAGLLELRNEWTALVAAHPAARFYHEFDWYAAYLRHLEQNPDSVHFFSFFRGGRPVAIFPLRRLLRPAMAGLPPLHVWELPCHAHTDLCDCLMTPREDGTELLSQLAQALRGRDAEPWDALHLPNVIGDACSLRAFERNESGRTLLVRNGRSMSFRCDSGEPALNALTDEFKRNLRRQRRRLEQLGRVQTAFVQEPGELDQAFAAFMRIEASGWKGRNGSAIALHPHLVRFYRELVEHFGARQRCLINMLEVDGKVIAAQFGIIAGRTLYLLKIAYDEAYGSAAPGNQLLYEAIRYCSASSVLDRLSLTTGPAWAEQRWKPDVQEVWSAYLYNSNARGVAAYAATRVKSAAVTVARACGADVLKKKAAEWRA